MHLYQTFEWISVELVGLQFGLQLVDGSALSCLGEGSCVVATGTAGIIMSFRNSSSFGSCFLIYLTTHGVQFLKNSKKLRAVFRTFYY